MLGFMWGMYRDRRLNLIILGAAVVGLRRQPGPGAQPADGGRRRLHEGHDPPPFHRGHDQRARPHPRPARARSGRPHHRGPGSRDRRDGRPDRRSGARPAADGRAGAGPTIAKRVWMRRRRAADCDDVSAFPPFTSTPVPFLAPFFRRRFPHPPPSARPVARGGALGRRSEAAAGAWGAGFVGRAPPSPFGVRRDGPSGPQAVSRRAANGRPKQRSRSGSPRDDPGQGSGGDTRTVPGGAPAGAPCPPGATAVRPEHGHPTQASGKPRARERHAKAETVHLSLSRASRPPLRPPPHLRALRRRGRRNASFSPRARRRRRRSRMPHARPPSRAARGRRRRSRRARPPDARTVDPHPRHRMDRGLPGRDVGGACAGTPRRTVPGSPCPA
jgi:hypothetical protein